MPDLELAVPGSKPNQLLIFGSLGCRFFLDPNLVQRERASERRAIMIAYRRGTVAGRLVMDFRGINRAAGVERVAVGRRQTENTRRNRIGRRQRAA